MAAAEAMKSQARLEDLELWVMEKTKSTKKGTKVYACWMASWREGGELKHHHIGNCNKIDEATALRKARKLKAIHLHS